MYWDLGRARVNRQRMDVAAHQFSGGSIDHPVPLQRGNAGEAGGGDDDVKMAAFPCARVAFVLRAVVADFEQGRVQGGFERRPQTIARGTRSRGLLGRILRAADTGLTPNDEDAGQRATTIQTLNETQSASLRCHGDPDVREAERHVENAGHQRRVAPGGGRYRGRLRAVRRRAGARAASSCRSRQLPAMTRRRGASRSPTLSTAGSARRAGSAWPRRTPAP